MISHKNGLARKGLGLSQASVQKLLNEGVGVCVWSISELSFSQFHSRWRIFFQIEDCVIDCDRMRPSQPWINREVG